MAATEARRTGDEGIGATENEQDAPVDLVAALKDLIQTPGWKLLVEHVDKVWGPRGYGIEMQRAIASVPPGPDRAYELARVAEQTDATAKAIDALIKWPTERIKALTPEPPSRRPFAGLRRSS